MKDRAGQIGLLAALLAAAIFSLFEDSINAYFFQIIIYIGINLILAVSLNLINGVAGQFSLGHAGFMAVGAYTSALFTSTLNVQPDSPLAPVLFLAAIILGGLVAAGAGFAVGIPSLRLSGDYLALTTLGFSEIIRVIIQNMDILGAARGFTGIPKLTNGFWVFGVAAVTVYVVASLVRSTYGKAFLALRDDEIAARAMGVHTTRYKVTAFVLGSFFAGMAGALYAHFVTYINPSQFGFMRSVEIVVMVIIGGMGSTIGVMFSAAVLTILPEALRGVAEYRMILYSLLLIVIMITRPRGLFGKTYA